jgi:hypothetical protein
MSNTEPFMLRLGHLELSATAEQVDETLRATQRLVASQRLRALDLADMCNVIPDSCDIPELFGLPYVLSTPIYERRSSQLLLAHEQPTTRLIIASKRPLEIDFTTDNALSAWVHMPTNRLRVVGHVPHESAIQKQQQIGRLLSHVGTDRTETTLIAGVSPEAIIPRTERSHTPRRLSRLLRQNPGTTQAILDSPATTLELSGFTRSGSIYHNRLADVTAPDDSMPAMVTVRN